MTAPNHWQSVAEEAILDYFRNNNAEPFHSDDLWHVIPDEHRGVISLAVMALVNKKLMVGCGYRKSAIPSRKRSPSQEYRLTELGRDRIAGHRAGGRGEPGSQSAAPPCRAANAAPSSVSGDKPTHVDVSVPCPAEGSSRTQLCASVDQESGSPAGTSHAAGELVLFDPPAERPLSPVTDAEAA
jgi:hypothetical protein